MKADVHNSKPIFSVLVPVYNVERYIAVCIKSVLKQTYQNFELILVDDGSTDKSGEICEEFKRRYPNKITVIHKKNGGLVSTRKAAVSVAKGEYAVCVDGDDWIGSDYLELFFNALNEHHADIIVTGMTRAYPDSSKACPVQMRHGYYSREDIVNNIFPNIIYENGAARLPMCVCGKCFPLDAYKKYQLLVPNEISLGEDAAVIIPFVYRSMSIYILDGINYFYRQIHHSMTGRHHVISFDYGKNIITYLKRFLPESEYDFKNQYDCTTVYMVFLSCITQFNRDDKNVKAEIRDTLNDPFYEQAICRCRFRHSLSRTVYKYILKYKCYTGMKIFNRIRIIRQK